MNTSFLFVQRMLLEKHPGLKIMLWSGLLLNLAGIIWMLIVPDVQVPRNEAMVFEILRAQQHNSTDFALIFIGSGLIICFELLTSISQLNLKERIHKNKVSGHLNKVDQKLQAMEAKLANANIVLDQAKDVQSAFVQALRYGVQMWELRETIKTGDFPRLRHHKLTIKDRTAVVKTSSKLVYYLRLEYKFKEQVVSTKEVVYAELDF